MPQIEETSLPGVGVRHEFVADDGSRVGVIHHRTGRREMYVCVPDDPDAVALNLNLSDDESHALAEALGGSRVIETLTGLQQQIEGLAIDWLVVDAGAAQVGKTIGQARIRTRTGVSVVAVIRDEAAFPAPGPEFLVEEGDTLVVVGTPAGITEAQAILTTD